MPRVEDLAHDVTVLILGGGRGTRLSPLTMNRSKPAVPIAAKYRLIDIPISNAINSHMQRMYVLTQFNSVSLHRHMGRTYRFDAFSTGYVQILAAQQTPTFQTWFQGTADAVRQNLQIFRQIQGDHVLILSGDHVYKMDYGPMLVNHVESGADISVCCLEVPVEEAANAFGVMKVDDDGRVIAFQEKPAEPAEIPGQPGLTLASMGNYVFNTEFLCEILTSDARNMKSSHDVGNSSYACIEVF